MSITSIPHRRLFSILFVILFCAAAGFFVNDQRTLLRSVTRISLLPLGALIILRCLFLLTNGLILRLLSGKFGIPLKPTEWIGLSFATAIGNFLVPLAGGMVARAAYMKHCHGLAYATFVSMLAATYLVYFAVLALAGLFSLLPLLGRIAVSPYLMALMAALFVAVVIPTLLPTFRIPRHDRLAQMLNRAVEGWVLIRTDRRLILFIGLYSFLNIFLNGLAFWVAFSALMPSPAPFFETFIVGLLTTLSFVLTVTPGNLGIQEAIVGLSSGSLGMGTALGLFVSLLIRVTTLVPAFILGLPFSMILGGRLAPSARRETP
jgi:uncharacterized membrane protein YbhN (UPF0104 family)